MLGIAIYQLHIEDAVVVCPQQACESLAGSPGLRPQGSGLGV
jgi:hypothetical protein